MTWSPDSWQRFEARQQPDYDDLTAVERTMEALATLPPLVSLTEVEALKADLAMVQAGRAFLLQGGDCAESFDDDSPAHAETTAQLLAAMADEIFGATGLPVIRLGRMAGQFAKPRSREEERRNGTSLPVWRGDIVNGFAFDAEARRPDPHRMLRAYRQSAAVIARIHSRQDRVLFSHEALLLPYEQGLVRRDPATGRYWAGSAHFLWIGDRTRFPGSAHVEFARDLANPIGIKCGPTLEADALLRLLEQLNSQREPGRLMLIIRLGAGEIERRLPMLMRLVRAAGHPVLWCCDPMHGNTVHAEGVKIRSMNRMLAEVRAFFRICSGEGVAGGGLHLELTGEPVQECDSGASATVASRLRCDPRLNRDQAMAIARTAAVARVGEALRRAS